MKLLRARGLWLSLSGIVMLGAVLALLVYGLRIGIDFAGGQLLEARLTTPVSTAEVRDRLETAREEGRAPTVTVAPTDEGSFLIRMTSDTTESADQVRQVMTDIGEWAEVRFERVGPTVGQDLTKKAILGVILASLAIVLYIAWAFRRVPAPTSSWQFGITAILALLHDLVITIGGFALLGHFFGYEIDALFITALLTVMGFSVHDTIVTYDRIRENLLHSRTVRPLEEVVNDSIAQTIVRSLNTSLTLILVLLSLVLLGGSSIRPFVSTLLIGVIAGTYSSVFVASQLLVVWQRVRGTTQERKNE